MGERRSRCEWAALVEISFSLCVHGHSGAVPQPATITCDTQGDTAPLSLLSPGSGSCHSPSGRSWGICALFLQHPQVLPLSCPLCKVRAAPQGQAVPVSPVSPGPGGGRDGDRQRLLKH